MKLTLPRLTLPKPAKIWAGRVAAAVLAAVVDALQHGKLPHTTADALALVSGAVVAATPVLRASGLVRPVAPGDPSLAQKALAAVQTFVKAPADKRKADAEATALALANKAKAEAEDAGKAAAQAEVTRLWTGLKTGQYQITEAGLVEVGKTLTENHTGNSEIPNREISDSEISNVAGTGPEVTIPQDDAPAVV